MFNAGGDEEEADFNITSAAGSKLANLFSFDQTPKDQSLTYTAPKQPKKYNATVTVATAGSQPAVLHAIAVHAYKLIDQKYTSQGKMGAAILGNHENTSYTLLLYKGKQQQVSMTNITQSLVFKVQSNKYATFYDDKKENWSILFESDQNIIDFAKQVALARANSSALTSALTQDLTVGEGNLVEVGDSVEIRFVGHLLSNFVIGQIFDSNSDSDKLLRVKLGKGKVIKGLEDGLIGAKKNTQRLVVIPPLLGYGAKTMTEKLPPNSTLIYDVFISKVKFSKDSRSATPSTVSNFETVDTNSNKSDGFESPRHSSVSNEDSVRARGASLSEQFTASPKSSKAKIISRMAKMGMPMLPGATIAHQASSESENEEEHSKRRSLTASPARETSSSPKPIVKPRPIIAQNVDIQQSGIVHPIPVNPQQQSAHHQMAVFQQQYPGFGYHQLSMQQPMFQAPPAPVPNLNDQHLPMLISETRVQNSEVRMTLGKISDRIETVISKLDQSKPQQLQNSPYMDAATLQTNIERIIQENIKWKSDVETKNSKITILNEKICDLLEKNQKMVEHNNSLMERRSDTFQTTSSQSHARLVNLEQEKIELTANLSKSFSKIAELNLQLQKCNEDREQMSNLLSQVSSGIRDDIDAQIEAKNSLVRNLEVRLLESDRIAVELNSTIQKLEEKIVELQNLNNSLEQNMLKIQTETAATHNEEINKLKNKLQEVENTQIAKQPDDDSFEEELKLCKLKIESLESNNQELMKKITKLQTQNLPVGDISQLETKLKRAMTGLYRSLQKEISENAEYTGKEVLQIALQSIRVVTVAILENETTTTTTTTTTKGNEESTKENLESKVAENVENEVKTGLIEQVENSQEALPPEKSPNVNLSDPPTAITSSLDQKYSKDDHTWRPQPPPPPLFDDDDEDDDDWLK